MKIHSSASRIRSVLRIDSRQQRPEARTQGWVRAACPTLPRRGWAKEAKPKAWVSWGVVMLAAFSLAGCKNAPSASAIQWQLERHIPGLSLDRESHIRIPRIGMAIAKKILRMTDEDEEDLRLISHVKRVDVATYRVLSLPATEALDAAPVRFEDRLVEGGWELMIREREGDERTWLFYRPGDEEGAITHLYVVTLDPYELVVVDLAGRIDRIIAEALSEEPGELVEIFGP